MKNKYADNIPTKQSFKEKFLATPPGPAREELIYQAAIRQPLPKLVPITVKAPNGATLTYKVLPDYLMVHGLRVPMSGQTAQRIANYFGMHLPTAKMSKQIWNAADAKIKPTPMSGGANIGGKWYSAEEVVNHKINSSDTSVAFNERINQEASKYRNPKLMAGHMKDIVAPEHDPDKLGLYGWYDEKGNPIQGGNGVTPHDTKQHAEYAAGTRLVSDKVIITTPDGKKIPISMSDLAKPEYKQYANIIYNKPPAQPVKYKTEQTVKTDTVKSNKKPNSDLNEKINQFLEGISKMF